jgi:hypothetical protein
MKSLIQGCQKLNLEIENKENQSIISKVNQYDQETLLNVSKIYDESLGKELAQLWKDKTIQKAYNERSNFQLLDSTE